MRGSIISTVQHVIYLLYFTLTDGVPPDGTPLKVFNGVHITITVVYDVLAIVGIMLAITCVIFNVVFRDRKLLKCTFIDTYS